MNDIENAESLICYTSEPPTLQNIALVSVAIGLWTETNLMRDLQQYSENFGFDGRNTSAIKAYDEFRERVLKKLSELFLPDLLKIKVIKIIPPIGFQLLKGFAKPIEHNLYSNNYLRFLKTSSYREYCRFYDIFELGGSVHWTMEGTIDNVSSLKEIIHKNNQEKDFYRLFELASKYCLEHISDLWRKIPKDKKKLDLTYEDYDGHLVAYWTAAMENELLTWWRKIEDNDSHNVYDNNLSIYENMISLSVFVSNQYSLKYFWQKLEEHEKNANVRNWITQATRKYDSEKEIREYQQYNDKTTILCFLLSQMNDEKQQKEVFRNHCKTILKALFFYWPWQKFFLPTITKMLCYIPENCFVDIMSLIPKEIRVDREIVTSFREIWFKSSLKLKKSFFRFLMYSTRSCTMRKENTSVLYCFLDIDDVETIFIILKYANSKEKKKIIFKLITNYELYRVINSNKLCLMESLLKGCLQSTRSIAKLKNFIMLQHASDVSKKWILRNDFQAVEAFLIWGFQSPKRIKRFKRNIIDKNEIFTSLVRLGDYELVDRFLNWYFESEDEIYKFKKAYIFEDDEDCSLRCLDLLQELSYTEQGWDLFEKFIKHTCSSPEEVKQFKSMVLKSIKCFLYSSSLEFASKLVNWCHGTEEEVNRFKNLYVTSDEAIDLILFDVNSKYPIWSHVSELVKWFSISKTTAATLKSRVDEADLFLRFGKEIDADKKRRGLLYLLDKHAAGNNVEVIDDTESGHKDSDIETEMMEVLGNKL